MRIQKIFLNAFIACVASGQFINWKGECKSVPKIKKFNLQKVFCYYFLRYSPGRNASRLQSLGKTSLGLEVPLCRSLIAVPSPSQKAWPVSIFK